MAMNLWEHEQQLHDLELAFVAAVEALAGQGDNRHGRLQHETRRLNVDGAKGTAMLLAGKLLRPRTR